MKTVRKILCVIFSIVIISSAFVLPCFASVEKAAGIEFNSEGVLFVCLDNGQTIFSKNPDKRLRPASLTKIMTALVVLNECPDLKKTVTVDQKCIDELYDTGSSAYGLLAGEEMSVYDMLCVLLIRSANDAATSLAYFVTGDDRQAFLDKMNDTAAFFGCKDTNFENVHGLDGDNHYTTPRDILLILENALLNPAFKEIYCKSSYQLPETNKHKSVLLTTTNFTALPEYEYCYTHLVRGGKTGFTSLSGHCLTTVGEYDGKTFLSVCMNGTKGDFNGDGKDENGAFLDTKKMYDSLENTLSPVSLGGNIPVKGDITVKYAKKEKLILEVEDNGCCFLPKDIDKSDLTVVPESGTVVSAPLRKGQRVCEGWLYSGDERVTQVTLVAAEHLYCTPMRFVTLYPALSAATLLAAALIITLIILLSKKGRKNKRNSHLSEKTDR